MAEFVLLRMDGPVAVLTLNRPDKLNALSAEVEDQLLGCVDRGVESLTRARWLFTVKGGRSAQGQTLRSSEVWIRRSIMEYYRTSGQFYEVLADLPIPSVVAIHGYCIGGGFEMSLACDVRVVEESAVFGLPEAALGILPSSGGLTRLVRMIGAARAKGGDALARAADRAASERVRPRHPTGGRRHFTRVRHGGSSTAGRTASVGGAHHQTGE